MGRRRAVEQVVGVLDVSELGQPRATQRYEKRQLDDEQILRVRIVSLARRYGRYSYRRVTAMLRREEWLVSPWENGHVKSFNPGACQSSLAC